MPAKKHQSASRSAAGRAKRSKASPASALAQANEVSATQVARNVPGCQTWSNNSRNAQVQGVGSLDISSLVTAISALVIQGLQAAGICAPTSSSSNAANDPTQVAAVISNKVDNITGLSGVIINTPLDSPQEPPTFSQFSSIAVSLESRVPDKNQT